jgi:hypothetical protein
VAGTKLWIGIDVGKQFHHACAVDADGKTVFSRKVKNRQAAIEELLTRTTTKAGEGAGGYDLRVCGASGAATTEHVATRRRARNRCSEPGRPLRAPPADSARRPQPEQPDSLAMPNRGSKHGRQCRLRPSVLRTRSRGQR